MDRDLEVVWQYGNICNAKCPYCINACEAARNYRDATFEETKRVVNVLNTMPVKVLHMLGGDPTCFAHMHHVLQHVNCPEVRISTNGILDNVIVDFANVAAEAGVKFSVYVSMHQDIVDLDPVAYRERIDRYLRLTRDGALHEFCLFVMVNGYKSLSPAFVDMCTWYVDTAHAATYMTVTDEHANVYLDTTFVRTSTDYHQQIVDFVKAYSNAKPLPPEVKHMLLGVRADIMRVNPWFAKQCPFFRHRLTLQLDGYMVSSDCQQKRFTTRSVYDPAFSWQDELVTCTCRQEHMVCNGGCMAAHGVPDYIPVDKVDEVLQHYLAKW